MKKKAITKMIAYILLFLFIGIFLFPVYWMVISSFKNNSALISWPPDFAPTFRNLENYITMFQNAKYITYFKNSLITSGGSVIVSLFVSVLAAYAFSRYRFFGKNMLMTALMNIQVFPVTVIVISLFTFYTKLGLQSTYRGLILAELVYSLPFTVWFLKAFMDTVPRELDEAAKIDGCSRLQVLTHVVLPVVQPGLIAISIYTFLYSWDDFVFAQIIMKKEEMKTLPVGMASSFIGEFIFDYAGMMTLSVLASLPVVVSFIFAGKYMVEGLTSGAVKG